MPALVKKWTLFAILIFALFVVQTDTLDHRAISNGKGQNQDVETVSNADVGEERREVRGARATDNNNQPVKKPADKNSAKPTTKSTTKKPIGAKTKTDTTTFEPAPSPRPAPDPEPTIDFNSLTLLQECINEKKIKTYNQLEECLFDKEADRLKHCDASGVYKNPGKCKAKIDNRMSVAIQAAIDAAEVIYDCLAKGCTADDREKAIDEWTQSLCQGTPCDDEQCQVIPCDRDQVAVVVKTLSGCEILDKNPDSCKLEIDFDSITLVNLCSQSDANDVAFKECLKQKTDEKVKEECETVQNIVPDCEKKKQALAADALDAATKAGSPILSCSDQECVDREETKAIAILKKQADEQCKSNTSMKNCGEVGARAEKALKGLEGCESKNRPVRCYPATTTNVNTPSTQAVPTPLAVPWKDLEEFSCQEPLPEKYENCQHLCDELRASGTYKEPTKANPVVLPLTLLIVVIFIDVGLFAGIRWLNSKIMKLKAQTPGTTGEDPVAAKLRAAYAAAAAAKDLKKPEKKEDKSEDVPSPPSARNTPAANKMRAKLLETQADLQKLRAHAKKCAEEHKADAASGRFVKKGAIYIPNEPDIPPPAKLPDNIILDKVEFSKEHNEMWYIGSDVDDIELDQDYVMNPDSITTEDEDDSKKSKKSKKSQKGAPSTSSAPAAPSGPPAAPSAPSAAPPAAPSAPSAAPPAAPSAPSAAPHDAKEGKSKK